MINPQIVIIFIDISFHLISSNNKNYSDTVQ